MFNAASMWDKNLTAALFSNKAGLLLFIEVIAALVLVVNIRVHAR